MPARTSSAAAAVAAMWARAPAPSVTFTASATPLSGNVRARRSSASHDTGGTISAVITNVPASRRRASVGVGTGVTEVCLAVACAAVVCVAIGGALDQGGGGPSPAPRIVQPSLFRAFLDTLAVHRYKVVHGICKQNRRLKRTAGLTGANGRARALEPGPGQDCGKSGGFPGACCGPT